MDDLQAQLAHLPVFSKLTAADRVQLARLAKLRTYAKGEFICWQGEVWTNVVLIMSGQVAWAILSPEGKRQVVFEMNVGEVMWGHSFFDDQPMPASLEVAETCEAYIWPREAIWPLISHNAEAVWDVTRLLVKYMRRARQVIYGFAFHSVAGRVAQLLLSHYTVTEGQVVLRDLTLEEMAAAVGTTRELVCKVLYRFADEGLIQINRTEFVFTDRTRLEKLAGES